MSTDRTLRDFAELIRSGDVLPAERRAPGPLKIGVDLGTANLVLAVLDAANRPVAGTTYRSTVVRDGIVVDYIGAVRAVREMKAALEERLGEPLIRAAAAIPPGIHSGSTKAIGNVVEAADFELAEIVDEPAAAARFLGIADGAVVDVGGGTTGISVLKGGEVLASFDEATGGTHMTLVLAGARGVSFEEAEAEKLDPAAERDVFAVIRPVADKMASIVARFLEAYPDLDSVHIVGGACSFSDFEQVFAKQTGRRIVKPAEPLLVTPLGIAMFPQATGEK
ncbi:ethanolamine utilization protein EutJ [Rhodovulum sulfidophilum]|uniref:Ethanolamine utilization protein EutJ n=1 Tax=Rhodovulum sulfidophilum TaxID=35806 RepID=A0ABS1RT76_RHOSU|nr:ethanolamine utilization protein EutJ [Rhodovulum sulfidophilum]MBL3553470.1 ethanolamine utilization protein EutJ [Rhodovulum sulfidophilum]MBL3609285.1 ethanolamine utilization protein EutJ [Rhodovulum sulfidophilum]MCE8439781.1 ethanolamine utilization protein EutJ [Rhodovulum sulfidophilum]MCE8456135.1 ethanolamine utilization protein EutJ [Rhodovulum sulfidophilum]NDK33979.1 ethanolamine utilization protein EutJ [Rhodovulum sulfidophilum]